MQKDIEEFSMNAKGIRKTEHPTGFSKIILEMFIKSKNITTEEIEKVIKLAETKYCPIWSMLKNDIELEVKILINK